MSHRKLAPYELALAAAPIPSEIEELICEANEHVEAFRVRRWQSPVPGFHASDFELSYRILAALDQHRSTFSPIRFVEWGSGIPCVAMIADRLGWSTLAVECDADLVEHAKRWLATQSHHVELRWGSFVPQPLPDQIALLTTREGVRRDVTDAPALTFDEIRGDVVYAYPWPGEAEFFEQLFLAAARPGDVLVLHHGSLMFDVQQCHDRDRHSDN